MAAEIQSINNRVQKENEMTDVDIVFFNARGVMIETAAFINNINICCFSMVLVKQLNIIFFVGIKNQFEYFIIIELLINDQRTKLCQGI